MMSKHWELSCYRKKIKNKKKQTEFTYVNKMGAITIIKMKCK